MSAKSYAEVVITAIENAMLHEMKVIGITKGATKKARDYSHVFVPGNLYGGKIGSMLCKRPWREQHIYKRGETRLDLCKQCREKLRKLAVIAADLFPQDLLSIAAGAPVQPMTAEDIQLVFREYGRRDRNRAAKPEQEALFEEVELTVPIRRTQPWTVPGQP